MVHTRKNAPVLSDAHSALEIPDASEQRIMVMSRGEMVIVSAPLRCINIVSDRYANILIGLDRGRGTFIYIMNLKDSMV